jgi:hypothetical protein
MHFFQIARIGQLILGVFVLSVLPFSVIAQTIATSTVPDGVASFKLSPKSGTHGVGKTFTVTVSADSPQAFNSANAVISFNKELLSVSSVSKTSSAFSLWAVEPTSSNSAGTVSFEGGNTTPLTGKKTLITITFKALKEGSAKVSFTSGSILAADGKGTDIAGTKDEATYEISASAAADPPPPPPPPPAQAAGPVPELPEVTSTTHPNENAYTNAPKAKCTWDIPSDVTLVRLSLDTSDKTVPTTTYDPAIMEKEFDQLTDGVMYFHLRYKNDAGFGATAHKKIMVDKTPPEEFPLEVLLDASSTDAILKFSATDTLSGLDRYEISIDGGTPVKVNLNEVKSGSYTLSAQSPGEHTVKISALDKAGNSMAVEGKFTIEGDPAAAKKLLDEEEEKPFNWRLLGEISLIAIIAFLIGYLFYEQSAFRHEKYLTKREADELRDNMGNIFAALREEVGEQTGRLFDQPNPSAQDREVMENINEAVDLSEELLSKEVEDVRKLLI